MGNSKNTNAVDLKALSPEELLAAAESSQAKVAELEAKLIDQAKEVDTALGKVSGLEKNISDTEAKVSKLEEDYETLSKERDSLLTVNQELQSALEAKPSVNEKPTVKHNKDTYYVSIPKFNHGGKIHTAETLKGNKELIAELVESGSAVLTLKED